MSSPEPTAWWDEVATDAGPVELRVRSSSGGVRVVVDGGAAGTADVVLPLAAAGALAEALLRAAGAPTRSTVADGGAPAGGGGVGQVAVSSASVGSSRPGERAPDDGATIPVAGDVDAGAALSAPKPWDEPLPDHEAAARAVDRVLGHIRRLAAVLPDTAEVDHLGDPSFRVATRMFAVVETLDGVPVLRIKVDRDQQAGLLADERFRADPDTGHHGWTNLRADRADDDAELDRLLLASYRLVAPADAIVRLDEALGRSSDR